MSYQRRTIWLTLGIINSLFVTVQADALMTTSLQPEDQTTAQPPDHVTTMPHDGGSSENPVQTTMVSVNTNTEVETSQMSQTSSTTQTPVISTTDNMLPLSSDKVVTSDVSSTSTTTVDEVGSTAISSTLHSNQELIQNISTQTPTEEQTISPSDALADNTEDVSASTEKVTPLMPSETSSSDNATAIETSTVFSDLTSVQTNMETMSMSSVISDGTTSNSVTMITDVPTVDDDKMQSTINTSEETATGSSSYMTTTPESSPHTSDLATLSTSNDTTTTDHGNQSQSTEMMTPENQTVTTGSPITKTTEMEETTLESTTSVVSTSTGADETAGHSSVIYEIHFSGDCKELSSTPSKKDFFIGKVVALFAAKLQIESRYINIQDIQCGSVYMNITFERVSSDTIEAMLTKLLNANTTVNMENDNNTAEYQLEDFQLISLLGEESMPTSTSELSTSFEDSTTKDITLTNIEFILKFTGECTVLLPDESGETDDITQKDPDIVEVSTETSVLNTLSSGLTSTKETTLEKSSTSTMGETNEHSTESSHSPDTQDYTPSTEEIPTPNSVTGNSNSPTITTATYTTQDQSTKAPTESSSTGSNAGVVNVDTSTSSQHADDTTSSTNVETTMETTTDLPAINFDNQYANLSVTEQFKTILTVKLAEVLDIRQNSIVLGSVSCGSVLINATIMNIVNKGELENRIHRLPDQSEELTITVEDDNRQHHTYKLVEVLPSTIKLPEQTTPTILYDTTTTPYNDDEDDEDGLTEVELIVIIVCSVIGGALLLSLLAFVIYRCWSIRNRKSFALGSTPAQMDLEDFTLTKMTRPSPVYTDQGLVYTNRPKQAPAYNNPIYHSSNGHYDNYNNLPAAGAAAGGNTIRSSTENLVPQTGGPHVVGGVENPSFASDDLLDSGSNTSTDLPYDGKVEMNVVGENSKLV